MNSFRISILIFVFISIYGAYASSDRQKCKRSSAYDSFFDSKGLPKDEDAKGWFAQIKDKSEQNGNYPIRLYGRGFRCSKLGESNYCTYVCKKHKVSYGYCYHISPSSFCYCEGLYGYDVWEGSHLH